MNNQTLTLVLVGGVALLIIFMMTRASQPTLVPMQYKNEETWQLVRDPGGRLTQIVVHRDAEMS